MMRGIQIDSVRGDLLIEHGRLVIGETTGQTVDLVLMSARGEYKEQPLLGGEAMKLLGGAPSRPWVADAKVMLRSVGVRVERIGFVDDGLEIETI
jgi:hypothetical protein